MPINDSDADLAAEQAHLAALALVAVSGGTAVGILAGLLLVWLRLF